MQRSTYSLILGLLVCLLLPLGLVSAEGNAPAAPAAAPNYIDPTEPNDTLGTATPAYHFSQTGYFLTTADVDYYRFALAKAEEAYAAVWIRDGYTVPPVLGVEIALLNAAGTVVAQDTSCVPGADVRADLPAGAYYVRVKPCAGMFDIDAAYDLTSYGALPLPTPLSDVEPNNTLQTANLVTFGQTIFGQFDGYAQGSYYDCAGDDWYRFQGRAGDVLDFIDPPGGFADSPLAWLYDADGNRLEGQVVLPSDGTYYLRVLTDWWTDDDGACQDGPYFFTLGESLWVSAAVDGLGGNAAIKRGDIVTRLTTAGKWTIVFDASDVGITKDVVAFERMPNGTILMSLLAAQVVPGLGAVTPQDIIRFIPTSLGANTAGTFEMFLDGSDVGLTTAGEKIDAIMMKPNVQYPLHISISGGGSVPRQSGGALKVADEDLINFMQTAFGPNTAGAWRMNVDGSTISVPSWATEDLNAYERIELSPARLSAEIMTFTDNCFVLGATGTNRDVFGFGKGIWVKNLANKKIDGLAVGPAWTP